MGILKTLFLTLLLCTAARAAGPTTAPAVVDIEQLLDRRFSEVSFDGLPLEKALDILRERLKVNIVVNWSAVRQAGVEPDTRIKLHLWNVSLRQTLSVLITIVGKEDSGLIYRIGENVITITNASLDRPAGETLKMYDVRDLLDAAVARKVVPPAANQNQQSSDFEGAEELRKLVVDMVDWNLWNDAGGPGMVRSWSGRLLVVNSPAVQEHVAQFLAKLRNAPTDHKSGVAK